MKRFIKLWAALLFCVYAIPAQAGSYVTNPKFTLLDDNGNLASGACVYFYEPGTTTKKTIYTNQALTVAASNPITLDSRGEASIFGSGTYKIVANVAASPCPSTPDNITWTADNVGDIGGATVNTVATIAALRGYSFSGAWPGSVSVQGYYTATDGAGGPKRTWVSGAAAGTYVDNGGSIIVPTGGDGSAAWVFTSTDPLNVKWFGAKGDGTNDDTAEINAALTVGTGQMVYIPEGNYKISGSLVVYPGTTLKGEGSCDQFRAATAGSTISITHTATPGLTIARGATIDGVNFYYPNQVLTGSPTVYDWTIKFDYTLRLTDSGSTNGNNAGVNLKNITIHNAYDGIWLGGDVNAVPATVYGAIMMNNIRMYALHTGVYSGYTLSEVNVTDFVHSQLFWNDAENQDILNWPYSNGVAIWQFEATQGAQFTNCTFYGHRRGFYFSPQNVGTSTAEAYMTFLKVTGCIFDGLLTGVEVAGNAGLGGATFTGCMFASNKRGDTTFSTGKCYYSNESLNAAYVNFSGCNFLGTSGNHVYITNTSGAGFQRHTFNGCTFISANLNNVAGTYYNIYVNDLFSGASRARLIVNGCYFDNTTAAEATVTNINIPSISSLVLSGNYFEDTTAKIFNILSVTNSISIEGNSVVSTTASTFPTVSNYAAASAGTITLVAGNTPYYVISGTTGITSITASWPGRVVTLKFNAALTVTDGSNLKLAGNFVTAADSTLTLICDGTNWYEISRSTN